MAASGLAEDGHTFGVASQVLDIFSHPLEGCYLVLETEVAFELWIRQITERTKPVVEADDRDAERRQLRPVGSVFTPSAAQIAAAVDQTMTACLARVSSERVQTFR
jgi:hypothetical protein